MVNKKTHFSCVSLAREVTSKMILPVLIGVLVVIWVCLDQYWHHHWTRLGITQKKPSMLVGNAFPLACLKYPFGEFFRQLYNEFKNNHKFFGVYLGYRPVLIITDPLLLQSIMVSDFSCFQDRSVLLDAENDPLSAHLFNLPGPEWRDLRLELTPTFTSGKLRGMFPTIRDCGKVLIQFLENQINKSKDDFDFSDLLACFTTNVISSVAFGIENDCINNKECNFRKKGKEIFEPTSLKGLKHALGFCSPNVYKFLKFKFVSKDVEDFIYDIVNTTIKAREEQGIVRNDFMQLMIQLKNDGYVSVTKPEKEEVDGVGGIENAKSNIHKLTDKQVAAQTFVFYIAGKKSISF